MVGEGNHFFGMNLLVGLKQGCILNLVEFGCVGAEKKWGSVLVCGCGGFIYMTLMLTNQFSLRISYNFQKMIS